MELKLIIFVAAVTLFTACAKSSLPETTVDSHEIVVSIADSQFNTKCTLNGVKTSFSTGDLLLFANKNGKKINTGRYIYSRRKHDDGEGFVFTYYDGYEINHANFLAAVYPDEWAAIDKNGIVSIVFSDEQEYEENGTQILSAPMACFTPSSDDGFVFSNISCLLKIGVNCCSELDNIITIDTIKVINSDYMFGESTWNFTSDGSVTWDDDGEGNSISLVGCQSAGAISSTKVKYFYIIFPPILDVDDFDEETFTVKVILTNGKSVPPRTFTATKGGDNQIIKNTILDFTDKPEKLITINPSDLL